MDFLAWCGVVLKTLIEMSETSSEARRLGFISINLLAETMFGEEVAGQQFFRESTHGKALIGAVEGLESIKLIKTKHPGSAIYIEVLQLGRIYAVNPVHVWEEICQTQLNADQEQLLNFVNQLSPRRADNYAWLEWVSRVTIASSEWGDTSRVIPAARELEKLGFLRSSPKLGSDLELKATFSGLVWETRPALIQRLKSSKDGVFISHINEEWRVAHKVKSLLKEAFGSDLKVFVSSDYESLRGGDKWFSTILENLKSAQAVLVLLSKDSLYRPWIPYEAGVGEGAGAKVIPMVHMDFSLRELEPPLGEYHVRRLQNADSVRALIEDIRHEIKREPSRVDVDAFVGEIEALDKEAASGINEPGTKLVRTWIKWVITPIIRSLESEQRLLEEPRLKWDSQWKSVEGLQGLRVYRDSSARDRLEQFERFYPDIKNDIDDHDREVANLHEHYQKLFESIKDSSEVQVVLEKASSPESLSELDTTIEKVFNTPDTKYHLESVAGHIVNREKRLPHNYTTRKFWERFGEEFLGVLNHPPLKDLAQEGDAIAGRLLQIVNQLIVKLRDTREALSLKHDVSY